MKIFLQVFCLVFICFLSVNGNCAESYRTYFELSVEDDTGKRGIGTAADVVSGDPLIYPVGDKSLSLVFLLEPPPSEGYTLTVSISHLAKSPSELNTPILTQTFKSRIVGGGTGPLEFEVEQEGIRVSGVVALSLVQ